MNDPLLTMTFLTITNLGLWLNSYFLCGAIASTLDDPLILKIIFVLEHFFGYSLLHIINDGHILVVDMHSLFTGVRHLYPLSPFTLLSPRLGPLAFRKTLYPQVDPERFSLNFPGSSKHVT